MKYISLFFLFFLVSCEKSNIDFDKIENESINLVGTSWQLHESKEISSITKNGQKFPIIDFGSGGFGIQSSCNRIGGKMELTKSSFTFGSLTTTFLMCNEEQRKIEGYFHGLVSSNISYKYSNGILYLSIDNKMIGSFKRLN